jgi:hypothetical protein
MRAPAKVLILIETAVCFAPALLILLLGLLMVPVQIWFLFTGAGKEAGSDGAFELMALVTAGAAGVVALGNLLLWILGPRSHFLGRGWTLVGAIAGGVALLPYVYGSVDSGWWRFVGWMPLLCPAHLMYLGRAFLFTRAASHDESA